MPIRPKVHFIGIGGIGVSALARLYLREGWEVSGSDLHASEITKALEQLGAEFYEGTRRLLTHMPDIVIYSPAVKMDNQELKEAHELGIQSMSYPESLGQFAKNYYTIAIAGTHGKSTTASMIALILVNAGLDPTVVVGTKVKEFGDSNFRYGYSRYLIIEACENEGSFLNYKPQIVVITNIEEDHLDYYKNLPNILNAFKEFVSNSSEEVIIIANQEDTNIKEALSDIGKERFFCKRYFSLHQPESIRLRKIIRVPGDHNIQNALAALAVGRVLSIPDQKIYASLSKFEGTWRRFDIRQIKIEQAHITLVSDYGHHPTEVRVTLNAARQKWPMKKIICVFQPHQIWREVPFIRQIIKVLLNAPIDRIIVTDIYSVAGRRIKIGRKKSIRRRAGGCS